MPDTLKQLLGDPFDMRSFITSCLIVATTVWIVSVPCIPERCLGCNRRVCPIGVAKPLRFMSVVEWVHDTTSDLHGNGLCPTIYTIINKREN